jgi:hypothetical protein
VTNKSLFASNQSDERMQKMNRALQILFATFLVAGVGIARADDDATFDFSGTFVGYPSALYGPAGICAPSVCTLGGTLVLDITNGTVVSSAATFSGESPSLGSDPFSPVFVSEGSTTTQIQLQNSDAVGTIYIFIPATLVGYGGGPLSDDTWAYHEGNIHGTAGDPSSAGVWTLVSGSLTPEVSGPTSVPEGGTSSLYLLLAGACCFGAIFMNLRKERGSRAQN